MSEEPRRKNGQFAPGRSGNAEGARVRRPRARLTGADIDHMILDVAATKTKVRREGKETEMTLLEINLRSLATGGSSRRLSARDTVDLARTAAERLDLLDWREARAAEEERRKAARKW
ncbi:DUF5681 domain-containing protein [Sphingomonas adhaesiva]|uniref:DUF5681 domain-containing protein n=1 Tax=Sphingomonas adhaesiva TaxID=28212 RepID=UPI002FFC38A0